MRLELERDALAVLVARQLETLFLLSRESEMEPLLQGVEEALERCAHCFSRTPNKYYRRDGEVYFNPFHSGQYSIFLYFLSRVIFRTNGRSGTLADRVYYLNKCLNGLDLFYEVELPPVFFLDHPVGSVMGRAKYGNFFGFVQHCTVGSNRGAYPELGVNVKMMSGSKILGRCRVGDDVIVAANAYIKDEDVPDCSLVFGSSPNLVIKRRDRSYFREGLERKGA